MKKVIAVIAFIVMLSCQEEEKPQSDKGCLTGIPKGLNYRVLIRCCTRKEFLAGDNVGAGGTANWTSYTDHEWKAVADCSDC